MKHQSLELDKRIPEPELMDEHNQAKAYADADFSVPHEMFVDLLEKRFGQDIRGLFLDLGCGPCDVTIRFAKRFPKTTIHAIDGSKPMLKEAKIKIHYHKLSQRIKLFHAKIPIKEDIISPNSYDGVIVNSLLHHLPSQEILWQAIKKFVRQHGIIFVMDLIRPKDTQKALTIVKKYSGDEPKILQRDFYHSLLAAYRESEVKNYLRGTNLSHLTIERVTDRHFIVWGKK